MKKLIFLLPLAFLFMQSCVQEPISCFEPGITGSDTVDVGYPLLFGNCSFMASEYDWDFGDGTTGTGFSPTHAYSEAGQYIVTLTAWSSKKKKHAVSSDIVYVGNRWLSAFKVDTIPVLNPVTGSLWDGVSDNPDLLVRISPSDTLPVWAFTTPVNSDAIIPSTFDAFTSPAQLSNKAWTWQLLDFDGSGTYDTLGSGVFEGYLPSTNKKLILRDDSVVIELWYDVK